MRFLKVFISVAIGCGFLLKLPHLSAQGAKTYPVVSEVLVEFNGFQSVSEELVLGNVQLRAGMDYNAALVDQSIRTLYGTGLFEFVEVRVEDATENAVNLVFELIPK